MEQWPSRKKQVRGTEAPFKSRKNIRAGMFSAGSLGDAVTEAGAKKAVDMEAAKLAIRRRRTGEDKKELQEKAREVRLKAWWKYRENWKSVTVRGKVGKIHPASDAWLSKRVEFPDQTVEFITGDDSPK